MTKNPYHWLKAFATTSLPCHLLEKPHHLFDAAQNGQGPQYLYDLSCRYAEQNQCLPAPPKCLHLDYTNRYRNKEALFIDVWPGLQLQESPVYLSVTRQARSQHCRVFRLHYPADRQLYMSELQLQEKDAEATDLLPYEHAISLIFSYTLGTRSGTQKQNILQESGQDYGTSMRHEHLQ